MPALLRQGVLSALFAAAAFLLPAAATAQDDDGYVSYRMARGDTLYRLGERYFTSERAVAEVARLNNIRNPRRIPVGTVIRIPRRVLETQSDYLVVYEVTGPVTINGRTARPSRGDRIGPGSVIRTGEGGFISFTYPGDGTIALPSNTTARLERANVYRLGDLRDVEFEILGGRGSIRAPTLRGEDRFRSGTPVAVTAVRGTEYRISFDEESGFGTTEVTEGAVAVASVANEGAQLMPEAGFGVAASPSGLAGVEELLPPAEIASPGAVQTGETVEFAVAPPPGGVAVRTQIARDAGFLEMLAEEVTADAVAGFASLDDGRYFVRARGIAPNGLEGLSETFSFRRKRLGAEASVETSPLADGFRFAWRSEGTGITHIAFQLWREGEANAPLFDEIGVPGEATVVTGLEPGTYRWRVAAIQSDAEDGLLKVWGPEQSLTVSPE